VGQDESSADKAVGDDPFLEGDAGLLGEAQGGAAAAVGHRKDKVGVHRGFAGQLPTEVFADDVDRLAKHLARRVGEVDVLEDAVGHALGGLVEGSGVDAVVVDADDLTGLHLADVGGADGVEGAGFGGDAPGAVVGHSPDDQRPDPPGVPGRLDAVGEQEQEAVGALEVLENVGERVVLLDMGGLGEEVDDDLGVGGGLEDVAVLFVIPAQKLRVYKISVVGDGDGAH
jgi:hypothetical protein